MKEIYIIRHAESISNAGEKTDSHDSIPLSEKGKLQAVELVEKLDIVPELIVVSSYSRTRETAEPFIKKHSSVPIETWDVQEFTYLDPKIYNGTCRADRIEPSLKYWKESDIYYKTSNEVESFYEFTKRIEKFIEQLKNRTEKKIVIFSHGLFINGLKIYLNHLLLSGQSNINEDLMFKLKETHTDELLNSSEFPIKNASVHRIEI
ncbi:TPA: histidine phosphatase family protein [Candidatus Nomurabacteria bacterium]|nr:histidine phosphatase family protein [Candidatus Nomurabacteria bacterium]